MDRIKGVLGGKKKGAAKATPSGGAAGGAPKPAAVAVPLELPPVEADPLKIAIRSWLLSSSAATEGRPREEREVLTMTPEEVGALLVRYVPGVDGMYDRTGNLDLVTLMGMTYQNGLPIYASNAAVQEHTVRAIRTIFSEIAFGTRSEEFKRKTLARLVDGARACQAEQGRVIDAVYGLVTGRDSSLRDQVLGVVDAFKDLVMENLVHKLNPDAWKQSDEIPQKQVPHITSSYRVAVGEQLGLRGVESAKLDHCKFEVSEEDKAKIVETFQRMFVIDELCDLIVNDVNQQAKDADRLIDRDLLAKWAGDGSSNGGFVSHTIFYNEDAPDEYQDLGKPTDENQYQPFLNRAVALQVLRALLLVDEQAATSTKKSKTQ